MDLLEVLYPYPLVQMNSLVLLVIVSVLAYSDAFCNLLVIKAVLSIHEANVLKTHYEA